MRTRTRRLVRLAGLSYASLGVIPVSLGAMSAAALARDDRPRARALAFWAWTGFVALPLGVCLLVAAPASLWMEPGTRGTLGWVQELWARASLWPFLEVQVSSGGRRGGANAGVSGPAVVVANHASWLDPYVLMAMGEFHNVRFVSKREVFFIPLVGWVMALIGHVPLNRADKESGKGVLRTCADMFARASGKGDLPIVFFAEGSRPRAATDECAVGEFKIGAFKLAAETGVPIQPVSILGTRAAMPPGSELVSLDTSRAVRVLLHEPMVCRDGDVEGLRDAVRDKVASGLRELQAHPVVSR